MREPGDTTKAGGNVTTAGRPPVLPTERPAACLEAEARRVFFPFPYTFTEEGFLGHWTERSGYNFSIPLKRSVLSLQAVRKPLVPHSLGV